MISKIWKDGVGSKLIAELIKWGIISILTLGIAWFNKTSITKWIPAIWDILCTYYREAIIALLLGVIIAYIVVNAIKKFRKPKIETPLSWLTNEFDSRPALHGHLAWFPANQTLQTGLYRIDYGIGLGGTNVHSIPNIHLLMEHRVLVFVRNSTLDFRLAINRECYEFLSRAIKQFPSTETTEFISQIRGSDYLDVATSWKEQI